MWPLTFPKTLTASGFYYPSTVWLVFLKKTNNTHTHTKKKAAECLFVKSHNLSFTQLPKLGSHLLAD